MDIFRLSCLMMAWFIAIGIYFVVMLRNSSNRLQIKIRIN